MGKVPAMVGVIKVSNNMSLAFAQGVNPPLHEQEHRPQFAHDMDPPSYAFICWVFWTWKRGSTSAIESSFNRRPGKQKIKILEVKDESSM